MIIDCILSPLALLAPARTFPERQKMQTIWSRAIQAKSSCRCPSCLTNPSAVAKRRSTAAASRSFRSGDIATFFYSSVLATAAVADAERKDAKRKKLDASIAEAVEALKAVELEQQKRLQILYSAQHELLTVERQHGKRIPALWNTIGKTHKAQQTESLQNILERSKEKRLRSHSALETTKKTLSDARRACGKTDVVTESPDHGDKNTSFSPTHEDNSVVVPGEVSRGHEVIPEESVTKKMATDIDEVLPYQMTSLAEFALQWVSYDESSMDLTKGRHSAELWLCTPWVGPLSDLKILKLNTSIAKLIYRLLLMSLDGADPKGVVLDVKGTPWTLRPEHRPELHMRLLNMTDRLQKLKGEVVDVNTITPIPFPRYSNRANHQLQEDSLYKALQTSLAETSSIYDLLPNICYDLLVSKSPPSIHTYNMLIVRLSYLQHYQVVSAIIDSLFECELQPNEITTAAILRFYDYTHDFDAFKSYIEMMNGEGNRGLITIPKLPKIIPENQDHSVILSERQFPLKLCKLSIVSQSENSRQEKICIEKAPRNRDTYMALISGCLSFSDLGSALREYVSMIRSGWKPDRVILIALLRHCALRERMVLGATVWHEIVETYEQPDAVAYYWMLHLCAQVEESKTFDTVLQHGAVRQIIPADLNSEAFLVPMNHLERDNRLLEMLQEHIQIPGLASLTRQNQKVTQRPIHNIGAFLSNALKDADVDQLTRAREHMVKLNTITDHNSEHTDIASKASVFEPHRYESQKPPLALSIWSSGQSGVQGVSPVPELAAKRSVVSAQMSHIPVEHSPAGELSQPPELPTARRKRRALSHYRDTLAKCATMMVSVHIEWRAKLVINDDKDDPESKAAISYHSSMGTQLQPLDSSTEAPGISGQTQVLLSDNTVSHINVPLSLSSTVTSDSPEPKTTISSRNAISQRHGSSTIAHAETWELSEESNVNLVSQANETFTTPSNWKHLRCEQMTGGLIKNNDIQVC